MPCMKPQSRFFAARVPRHQVPAAVRNAVLALDGHGVIWDCDAATEALFKHRRDELVGQHISDLLPELRSSRLTRDEQLSPRLHLLCRSGRVFQAVASDGISFACNLYLTRLGNSWSVEVRARVGTIAASVLHREGIEHGCHRPTHM